MADPQHVEALDRFDQITVRMSRAGVLVGAAGLLAAGGLLVSQPQSPALHYAWMAVVAGTAACIAHMPLYVKTIRWVIARFARRRQLRWHAQALRRREPRAAAAHCG